MSSSTTRTSYIAMASIPRWLPGRGCRSCPQSPAAAEPSPYPSHSSVPEGVRPVTLEIVDLRGPAPHERLVPTRVALDPEVVESVREIVARVRAEGDDALFDLTLRLDGADLRATGLVVSPEEFADAERAVP